MATSWLSSSCRGPSSGLLSLALPFFTCDVLVLAAFLALVVGLMMKS
jgi:hypothetical protein